MLQWRYIAGNNWGMCSDGTGAVGCGAQEEFRACADINIGDVGPQPPLRPLRPGTKPTTTRTKSTDTTQSTTPTNAEKGQTTLETEESPSRLLGPIIAALTLLLVLCILASIYLYYYHGQRVKHLMLWKREQKTQIISYPPSVMQPASVPTALPPVPPPRTKRLSQTIHEIDANESSVLNGLDSTMA